MQKRLVPKIIDQDEPCVRCVMHPLMIKKNKLRRAAALPPPGKRDVSLLRLNYTTTDFCLSHGRRLSKEGYTFKCLATLFPRDVVGLNEYSAQVDSLCSGVEANVVYGPMHQGDYVLDKDVYVDDPDVDLPMHADLRYNQSVLDGEVSTKMRQYADLLVKKMEIIYKEP